MSSILESVRNTSSAKYDNIDANLAVNELAVIQEQCGSLAQEFKYTPDMVPIVHNEAAGEDDPKYCIDGECFQKMLKSNDLTVSDGIDKLFNEIEKDPNCDIETTCEMAIVVKEENTSQLYDVLTSDPSKIGIRTEAINKHIDFLKKIHETGCKILML